MGDRTTSSTAFGARLKHLREEAGISQAQLAEKAGMHPLSVAKLEQGQREPSWATVQLLAKALGAKFEQFAGLDSPPPDAAPRPRGRPRKKLDGEN